MLFSFIKNFSYWGKKSNFYLISEESKKGPGLAEPSLKLMLGISLVFHLVGLGILLFVVQKLPADPSSHPPILSTWVNLISLNQSAETGSNREGNHPLSSNPIPPKNERKENYLTPPKKLRNSKIEKPFNLNSPPGEKTEENNSNENKLNSSDYENGSDSNGGSISLSTTPDGGGKGNGAEGKGNSPGGEKNNIFPSADYLNTVRLLIERHKNYPRMASNRQIEGTVIIQFSITPEGIAREVSIIKSSGFEILDQAGIKAVRNASPFPPPPINLASTPIEVPIIFQLIN